ncbi:MAG: hypothetical protein HQK83_19700, partial [Fibrobacteria bacterium]|nr:hypothetical protein [Fibrobacteria bacterium]
DGFNEPFPAYGPKGCANVTREIVNDIPTMAKQNDVGFVSLGDDAAHGVRCVLGFDRVHNSAFNLNEDIYKQPNDRVWYAFDIDKDVPEYPGIINRAVKLNFGSPQLDLLSGNLSNADVFIFLNSTYRAQLHSSGYQFAFDGASNITVGGEDPYPVLSYSNTNKFRVVMITFQPEYLANNTAAEQLVYDATMWASFAKHSGTVAAPVLSPMGKTFEFRERVTLTITTPGADIYYRLKATDDFIKYTGTAVEVTETSSLQVFGQKEGWINSDTLSERYTKTSYASALEITKYTGEPLGSSSNLTELDSSLVITLVTPYASFTQAAVILQSETGLDTETITMEHPRLQDNALVFMDTIPFGVTGSLSGNGTIEAVNYDQVTVAWKNPVYGNDSLSVAFLVKPAPRSPKVYFADSAWADLTGYLVGDEPVIYVVVEDMVFDPAIRDEYLITLSNKKGKDNAGSVDREQYPLIEIIPGRYGSAIPVDISLFADTGNGRFEIQTGDELKVVYENPETHNQTSDIIGYGAPAQHPGLVAFTNEDESVPPQLMVGNIWDADKGMLYLRYTDDYIALLSSKKATVTVFNVDSRGRIRIDTETIDLSYSHTIDDKGVWFASIPLEDNPVMHLENGILQYYFKGTVKVAVATHAPGASEVLEGDTARAELTIARANQEESVELKPYLFGGEINRNNRSIEICVEDQVYSAGSIDTLVLDEVRCVQSGSVVTSVLLAQKAPASSEYCGMFFKHENDDGPKADTVLYCNSSDDIMATYTDPVYGTEGLKRKSIVDGTPTKLEFMDMQGTPISVYNEATMSRIMVRLIHKSPRLNKIDSLQVILTTNTRDSLQVWAVETSVSSSDFRAVVPIGFTDSPDKNDTILEGILDTGRLFNTMTITGYRDYATANVKILSAYVPVERAWIVDGNYDGQADSIYIRFQQPLTVPPSIITSIDWNYEGAQEYIVYYDSLLNGEGIHFVPGDRSTISIVVSGALDASLHTFPFGASSIDETNPPTLTLPYQDNVEGLEIPIEDGIGAFITVANLHASDKTYYKDTDGNLLTQPDTLIITLSEKIWPLVNVGTPWDSLFVFTSPGMDKTEAFPLVSLAGSQPIIQGGDSLRWVFIVDNSTSTMKPEINDQIFMNANAPYTDASSNANKPQEVGMVIQGVHIPGQIYYSSVFVPVIGTSVDDPNSLITNIHIDDNGMVVRGREVVLVQNQLGEYEYIHRWIKPDGLRADGTISLPGNSCRFTTGESTSPTEYPENCLSTVQVFSEDAYTAEIAIFDHLGKFVNGFVQYFGQCGELNNFHRRTPRGFQSWLVWNQKDLSGDLVGTGVYIWKVKFITLRGNHSRVYRQGIIRTGVDPSDECAK